MAKILLYDIPFIVFLITFVYAIIRSRRKLHTVLMTFGAILFAGFVSEVFLVIGLNHGIAASRMTGESSPLYMPVEMVAATVTTLAVSARSRNQASTGVTEPK